MFCYRALIVVLICSVIARENFTLPRASCSRHHAEATQVAFDESPDAPCRDEMPPVEGEIPVILEVDLDPEAEEMLCFGDHKPILAFAGHCGQLKNIALKFASSTSFCTFERLRN